MLVCLWVVYTTCYCVLGWWTLYVGVFWGGVHYMLLCLGVRERLHVAVLRGGVHYMLLCFGVVYTTCCYFRGGEYYMLCFRVVNTTYCCVLEWRTLHVFFGGEGGGVGGWWTLDGVFLGWWALLVVVFRGLWTLCCCVLGWWNPYVGVF